MQHMANKYGVRCVLDTIRTETTLFHILNSEFTSQIVLPIPQNNNKYNNKLK